MGKGGEFASVDLSQLDAPEPGEPALVWDVVIVLCGSIRTSLEVCCGLERVSFRVGLLMKSIAQTVLEVSLEACSLGLLSPSERR